MSSIAAAAVALAGPLLFSQPRRSAPAGFLEDDRFAPPASTVAAASRGEELEEARAAESAAVEAQKRALVEIAAQRRELSRARRAAAESQAKARALLAARKSEEARCGSGARAAACLAEVAARYRPPPLPPVATPSVDSPALDIAPLIPPLASTTPGISSAAPIAAATSAAPISTAASAAPISTAASVATIATAASPATTSAAAPAAAAVVSIARPAASAAAVTLSPRTAFTAHPASNLGRAGSDPKAPLDSSSSLALPRDSAQGKRRSAEVVNDLQVGPQSLVLDNFSARGEIVPGALQLHFGYRFAVDDASAPHHLFLAGLESGRCLPGDACGLRWFARGGFGPHNASDYAVDRRVNGTSGTHKDTLGWSAAVLQAGLGYATVHLVALADAQVEDLTADYLRNIDLAGPSRAGGSVRQLRLRGTLGVQSGGLSAQARVAIYSYSGEPTATFRMVPLRGALLEDDAPGLASALQSYSARLEARWESAGGTALAASFGFLSYAGPLWLDAHVLAGSLSQRFGIFRLGAGLVAEQETDALGNGYPTVFGTGTLSASF